MTNPDRLLRLFKASLIALVAFASLAQSIPTATAATGAELLEQVQEATTSERVQTLFSASGGSVPRSQYYSPPRPESEPQDQLGFQVCTETGQRCAENAPDAVTFQVVGVHFNDRQNGVGDSWTYVFRPFVDGELVNTPLRFLYRANEDEPASSGFILGVSNDGFEISDDFKMGDLEDFQSTPLARYLDQMKGEEAMEWAEENDIAQTGAESGVNVDDEDPFTMVIQKIAEIINSLSASVLSALLWAVDAGNLSDNEGLTEGWMVVRDIVNLLFVLVLLGLALMSIIRVEPQKYNVRQLLPILVFSILAVNFSFLIASILANTATVLSQPFVGEVKGMFQTWSGVGSAFSSDLADGFGEAIVLLIASLIILFALLVLLFFFVIRIVVIWVIAVLSPVVLLFLTLPFTRGESNNLIKVYIRWVYMAPVAFLLLYVSTQMLQAVLDGSNTGHEGATAIIQALFFAGVIGAAVMIPLALGGRIASAVSRPGARIGKGAGKGGLGLAGALPLGGGMTVGEASRTAGGYFKLRKDAQERRGLERAAGLQSGIHERLGDSAFATALTGRDLTQAQSVTERLVDDQLKENRAIGFQRPDAQAVVDYSIASPAEQRRLAGDMTKEQLAMAESPIGQRAAAKQLAQEGFWNYDTLRHFGNTGYQNLMEGEPIMKHAKRKRFGAGHQFTRGDFNTTDLSIEMGSKDGDGMRGLYPNFWTYADAQSADSRANPVGHEFMKEMLSDTGLEGRTINFTSLRQNVDTNHRNVAAPAKRALQFATYRVGGLQAKMNLIAGNLAAKEWTDMAPHGGPTSRNEGERELERIRRQLSLDGKRRNE